MLITGADSLYIFSPPYEQLATMGILLYMAEKYRVYSPVILRKKLSGGNMAKLHFKYGVMGSAKSLDLIRANYNYREKGMDTIVLKPDKDSRDGDNECVIKARVDGVSVNGSFIPSDDREYDKFIKELKERLKKEKISAIFIDEAQFLSKKQVEDMYGIVYELDVPVLCYGLKNNFRSELFEGSKRLLELADDLQEIIGICHCGRKAKQNVRIVNGSIQYTGDEVVMGGVDEDAPIHYIAVCNHCYFKGNIKL